MNNVSTPSRWHTLSKESEKLYNELASKTVANFKKEPSPDHLYFFMRDNRNFVRSEAKNENSLSDAGAKETQNTVMDFLDELNQELPKEEQISVVELYHTFF